MDIMGLSLSIVPRPLCIFFINPPLNQRSLVLTVIFDSLLRNVQGIFDNVALDFSTICHEL